MNALQLVAIFLQFLGAVFLSLGLIKSHRQIEDESTEFWGENPFLRTSMLSHKRFVDLGFGSLVAGFSLQFSTHLTLYPEGAEVFGAVGFGILLSLLGWLVVMAIGDVRKRQHERIHRQYYRSQLLEVLQAMLKNIEKNPDRTPRAIANWKRDRFAELAKLTDDLDPALWQEVERRLLAKQAQLRDATSMRRALSDVLKRV